jgi:hypothetical protein
VRGILCFGCNVHEGNGRNYSFWERYRRQPPTVICRDAYVYNYGAHVEPDRWVIDALGPMPKTPAELAAYLAAAAVLTPPRPANLFTDNAAAGLL